MKITNVEPFAVDAGWIPWVFVKVETDEGITGYGEVSEWRAPRGCIGTVRDLGEVWARTLAEDGHAEERAHVARIPDPSLRFGEYLIMCRQVMETTDHWRLVFGLWATPFYEEKVRVQRRGDQAGDGFQAGSKRFFH